MKAKKKVFVVAVAVCLIAILSMSSLAWFSDKDEVTNQFMISTSDDTDDPDGIFSVDIWELVPDGDDADEDPDKISVGDSTEGGLYEHIYPSQNLIKEPHVENTGKYDQWIRVKVTVSKAQEWTAICNALANANGASELDLTYIFQGHDSDVWTRGKEASDTVYVEADNTITYTYYLDSKLAAGDDVALFESITIPKELNQENLATLNGGFTIKLVAEAIQADNTGDNAPEAFNLVMGD